MNGRRRFSRAQRLMILSGIIPIVVLIVTLQLWLLTATMNAYLGGDDDEVAVKSVAIQDLLVKPQ